MHRVGVVVLRAVMRRIGRRSSRGLRRFIVVMSRLHLRMYRVTRGRLGGRLGLRHGRTLMLTTTGRRTGRPRTVPLLAIDDDDDLAVIASHGGLDQPPGWLLNLDASPRAVVELPGERFSVRAERAAPDHHTLLWERFVRAYPGYQDYRARTTREFPIVILRRTGRGRQARSAIR